MRARKVLLIICAVIVIAGVIFAAFAKPKLSDMSDEELIQYVTDAGVTIPTSIGANSIRLMIKTLEEDPEHMSLNLNWSAVNDLFEDLREVVNAYYGMEP